MSFRCTTIWSQCWRSGWQIWLLTSHFPPKLANRRTWLMVKLDLKTVVLTILPVTEVVVTPLVLEELDPLFLGQISFRPTLLMVWPPVLQAAMQ